MLVFQEEPAPCFLSRSQSLVSRAYSSVLYSGCIVKDRGELWNGFMLKWILFLGLTEVFFPFKDDIAILTKFKPSRSEGIVLTSVLPSSLLSVSSILFFFSAGSLLEIRLWLMWVIGTTYEPFAVWFASQLSAICWQLSWLRSNWAFPLLVLGAVLEWGPLYTSLHDLGVRCLCCSCSGIWLHVLQGVNMLSMLYFSVNVCFAFSFYLLMCCSRVIQISFSGTEIPRGFPSTSCICNQLWYWESI